MLARAVLSRVPLLHVCVVVCRSSVHEKECVCGCMSWLFVWLCDCVCVSVVLCVCVVVRVWLHGGEVARAGVVCLLSAAQDTRPQECSDDNNDAKIPEDSPTKFTNTDQLLSPALTDLHTLRIAFDAWAVGSHLLGIVAQCV